MTDLGKVGMRPRGEHVDGNVYEKNDIVKYENVVYCCLKDTPNAPSSTDTEFWQVWARDASSMVGATSTTDGAGGIVPKPMRGDENKALLGSGIWGDVNIEVDDALSDTSENPVQNKVVAEAIKNASLDKTGDSKDVTVSFTSNDALAPTELAQMPEVLKTGEKHSSILEKASTVFRNMRYIIGLLGSTDISKETLGLGDSTLTGAVSAINESLKNVDSDNLINSTGGYGALTTSTAPYKFAARIGDTNHRILPFTQIADTGSFVKIDYDGIGGIVYNPGKDNSMSQKKGTILLNSYSGREFHLQREDVTSKDIQLDIYVDNTDSHKFYLDIYSKYSAAYMYLTIHDVGLLWLWDRVKLTELKVSNNPPENATKLDLLAF